METTTRKEDTKALDGELDRVVSTAGLLTHRSGSEGEGVDGRLQGIGPWRTKRVWAWAICLMVGVAVMPVTAFFGYYLYSIRHSPAPDIIVTHCEAPIAVGGSTVDVNVTTAVTVTSHSNRPTSIDIMTFKVYYPTRADGVYLGKVELEDVWIPAYGQIVVSGLLKLHDVLSYPKGLGAQLMNERLYGRESHSQFFGATRARTKYGPVDIRYRMKSTCSLVNNWGTQVMHTECNSRFLPWWAVVKL